MEEELNLRLHAYQTCALTPELPIPADSCPESDLNALPPPCRGGASTLRTSGACGVAERARVERARRVSPSPRIATEWTCPCANLSMAEGARVERATELSPRDGFRNRWTCQCANPSMAERARVERAVDLSIHPPFPTVWTCPCANLSVAERARVERARARARPRFKAGGRSTCTNRSIVSLAGIEPATFGSPNRRASTALQAAAALRTGEGTRTPVDTPYESVALPLSYPGSGVLGWPRTSSLRLRRAVLVQSSCEDRTPAGSGDSSLRRGRTTCT
jgi:hypothetical protein